MKEIIWVFGTSSAVGKKTFCEYITKNPSNDLLDKLALRNKKLAFSRISIEATAQYYGDQTEEKRINISDEVGQLTKTNDVIFVKWQYLDMEKGVFNKVQEMNPGCVVRIILLKANDKVSASRLSQKSWWQQRYSDKDPVNFIKHEKEKVEEVIGGLQDKYSVSIVESNPNYNFTYHLL